MSVARPPGSPRQLDLLNGDHRQSWAIVLTCLALYTLGFLIWRPTVITVADESCYVRQAQAFARGEITVPRRLPFSSEIVRVQPSFYPAGTSLLQTPFVLAGGWRAAFLLSLLSLIATTLLLAKWLTDAKRSPLFALLFLGYLPVLVFGRVAMSDLPSAVVVTLGLWMFWRGNGRPGWWLGASFFAGASLLFREANPLMFVFFFAGALWQRERTAWALVAGGLSGVGLRLASAAFLYGDPLFIMDPLNRFDLVSIARNAPIYLLAMLVMVPGGLAGALLYRGQRRPVVLLTVIGWLAFYFSYQHSGRESGALKQLVQGPRYFIPLVPLLAFAMAESLPRLWTRWEADAGSRRRLLHAAGVTVIGLWILAVAIAAFGVHPAMDRYNRSQATIVEALYSHTTPNGAIVSNLLATQKFINELYGPRILVNRPHLKPSDLPRLLAANGSVQLAFLDRLDSDFYREDAAQNDAFVCETAAYCRLKLLHDKAHSPSDHLRIWDVRDCGRATTVSP